MSERYISEVPRNFLDKEMRQGFVVGEVMKKCWAAQIKVLEEIGEFCQRHSLRFYADAGTLLGTIRHQGFIPWDDDIDIMMLPEDYITFCELFPKEKGDRWQLLNPYTKSWFQMNFSRITYGNDMCFEKEHLEQWYGCPFLVGVDIFPYYYVPRNCNDEKWIVEMLGLIDETISLNQNTEKNPGGQDRVAERLVRLEHETGYQFTVDRPINNQLEILYDQVCRVTTAEEADYVTRYEEYTKNKAWRIHKEIYKNLIYRPFEYIQVPTPYDSHSVLEIYFGKDYMTPKNLSLFHEYPFFKKQMYAIKPQIEKEEWGKKKEMNTSVKPDSGKCKVLFYQNICDMIVHSEKTIEKLKSVFDYFRNNKEKYILRWIPAFIPSEGDISFDLLVPQMLNEYNNMKDYFLKEKIGICDEGIRTENAVKENDVFYGDEGILMQNFLQNGKKTIQQDYYKKPSEELIDIA